MTIRDRNPDNKSTTLLRTDRNGWITLSTDGTQLWVDVEKK